MRGIEFFLNTTNNKGLNTQNKNWSSILNEDDIKNPKKRIYKKKEILHNYWSFGDIKSVQNNSIRASKLQSLGFTLIKIVQQVLCPNFTKSRKLKNQDGKRTNKNFEIPLFANF